MKYPVTPDGRYFVVQGRLWRCSDPSLSPDRKAELVSDLMAARRALARSRLTLEERKDARYAVDAAKTALGERGAVWWENGDPDYNRHKIENTPYRNWFKTLGESQPANAKTISIKAIIGS